MKLLFVMRNVVYARNFEWTLSLLAERGHDVHLVADPHPLEGITDVTERLCREYARISRSLSPAVPFNAWTFFGGEMRRAQDYLRYLRPEFAEAPKLRARAARNAPPWLLELLQRSWIGSSAGRWILARLLRVCDRAHPVDPRIEAFVKAHDPDLVVVTPLVEPSSPQSEYLRAARALGRRTAVCVHSWDNLTNKGLIHDQPDLVAVWNEAMKDEAVRLHGVLPARVAVTGAVPYDHWFRWSPRGTRDEFCAQVGLDSGRPYLLYLCSSRFIAPNETAFIRGWISQLRQASPPLCDVSVLVRPHPQNVKPWREDSLGDLPDVVVWPAAGQNPSDEESRSVYFDSIFHSAAVVGINTSAQIESAILGKGVYTVLADEFRDTQEGTLHFGHLRGAGGGLLHVGQTMSDHLAQLEQAVRGEGPDAAPHRFVAAFVRPYGLEEPASPRLVSALEAVASLGRRRADRGPWWGALLRPMLAGAAVRLTTTRRALKEREEARVRLQQERNTADETRREQRRAVKQRAQAERALQKQENAARRAAEQHAEAATAARAYAHYEYVRDRVRVMSPAGGADPCLSTEEAAVVQSLATLWTAAPGDIARLRRLCDAVSGVWAADYDDVAEPLRMRLGRDLHMMLKQVPRGLFVQEPTALGGFGVSKGGLRFNADTLKHFKAMVALQDGGLLGAVRGHAERRLVWEIGGGWGGFAYQFKTVCPDVTYVITGTPDLFLASAVYLMTLFPDARIRFYGDCESQGSPWHEWENVDFVFVPERSLSTFRPPRLDLVMDIASLRQMTDERIRRHVELAFELGAPYVYSLLPTEHVEADASRVWGPLERMYWPNPVPPRVDKVPPATIADGGPLLESDYTHMAGWRRLRL